MNSEISVIVPVYNTEKYLQECIDSILHQTITNFEILLIDDGSTDNSGVMCDEYATDNPNVRAIHLEHSGLSIARNVGIQNAQGKYLSFVDSDDILKPNFLATLHENLLSHNADMAIANYCEYHEEDGKFYFYITDSDLGIFELTPQQAVSMQDDWTLNTTAFVVPFGKLVKKELLNNFRFPENMMYEDEAAIHRMILACKKIVLVNDSLYTYRIRPNSLITSAVTDKRLQDLARAFEIRMSDFSLVGINTTPAKKRFIWAINNLMAKVPNDTHNQPGYRECQEIINLANQNTTSLRQVKEDPTNASYGITVKNIQQTLDFVLENHSSVARFGDGELDLMSGHNIPYQRYHPALATRLKEILHTSSNPNIVVCLVDVFHDLERYNDYVRQFWDAKLADYAPIFSTLRGHGWFGSAFISRPYIDLADKFQAKDSFHQLKQLWDDRDLLIVEGKLSRSGVGNDLFVNARSIQRILGPSHDAFDRYDDLLATIKQYAENKLILLMLGPTAKLLAYDLAQDGHQAIDLGHIDSEYEWFKMGATEKVALPNKHTAEHNFDENVVVTPDKDYDAQIIADLSTPQE